MYILPLGWTQLYFHQDLPLPRRHDEELELDLTKKKKERKKERKWQRFSQEKLPSSLFNSIPGLSYDQEETRDSPTVCRHLFYTCQDGSVWAGCHSLPSSFQEIIIHLWDYFRRTAGLFMDSIYFISGSSLDLNFSLFLFSTHLRHRFSPSWTRRSKHPK